MKKMFVCIFIFLCVFVPSKTYCTEISSKTSLIDDFNTLLVQDALEVILKKSNTNKVVVETEVDFQDNIIILNNNKKLSLKIKEDKNNSSLKKIFTAQPKVIIYVYYINIEEIFLSGASTLSSTEEIEDKSLLLILSGASVANLNCNVDWLSVNCTGASKCILTGKSEKLNLKCTGASNINSKNLSSNIVDADVSGASDVSLSAIKEMKIIAAGASNVKYKVQYGTKISKTISGASNVNKI
jgi:hypothetical protein